MKKNNKKTWSARIYFSKNVFLSLTCMCKHAFGKIIFVRSMFSCVRAPNDLCARTHAHSLEGTLLLGKLFT